MPQPTNRSADPRDPHRPAADTERAVERAGRSRSDEPYPLDERRHARTGLEDDFDDAGLDDDADSER